MILERPIPPFLEWLLVGATYQKGEATEIVPATLPSWFLYVGILLVLTIIVGATMSILRHGFGDFVTPFRRAVGRGFQDLVMLSLRRTWAIARLTIKESLRRRVMFVFALFMVILLIAGWFLDPGSENPARLYFSFVMGATSILVLLLSLFLSAFSLPTDFKTKTIYSVVTKPVRSSEIVLGRILGIALIGTTILVCMAVISFFFVFWGLQHKHLLIEGEDLTAVAIDEKGDALKQIAFKGTTRLANGHKHEVTVSADGKNITVSPVNGHSHTVIAEKVGEQTRYWVSVERGTLQARVPMYGKLGFRGKDSFDTPRGINVGEEWEYRSYIGGNPRQSSTTPNQEYAIFTFEGIREDAFPKRLVERDDDDTGEKQRVGETVIPVEMTLGVFRTHKGDIEKPVTATLAVRNPATGLKVDVRSFPTEKYVTKSIVIPRKINGFPQFVQRYLRDGPQVSAVPDDDHINVAKTKFANRSEFDLFEDFVVDGKLEIWLNCVDSGQYIGVAQADVYLRAAEGSVLFNFAKGFFGIWMQMIIIISFGVLFSTFLSGAVAMISSIGIMIAGFSKAFLIEIGLNKVLGGGPVESFYRLMIQQNMVVDLPAGFGTTFIKSVDKVFGLFMQLFGLAIPPLSDYAVYSNALVHGFNISGNWLLVHGVMTFSYVVPLFIVAYLILSNREVAK